MVLLSILGIVSNANRNKVVTLTVREYQGALILLKGQLSKNESWTFPDNSTIEN